MASASGWSMALTCWDMSDSVLVFVSHRKRERQIMLVIIDK
jgi:hypothetical protein